MFSHIHLTVAVPVGAAAALHVVTLIWWLAAELLTAMLGCVLASLMLLMVLVLGGRGLCDGGSGGEDERYRGARIFMGLLLVVRLE